jgi:hypothetical protein
MTTTITPTSTSSPTVTITPTSTSSPTVTITPTNTPISGTAVYIYAALERDESNNQSNYYIQVLVNSVAYGGATVSVDDLDDASPATAVPYNSSVYYLTGTNGMITPGHNIQVEVVIDGISHTANAIAPGNITLASDGNLVSWQYGEPGGNGGTLYIYRLSPYAQIYTGNASAPSPFTVPDGTYTTGDGLHRIMLSQSANYYEYQGVFVGCDENSRIVINTHNERSDINK